jgi:hypothetical protein
MYVTGFLFGQNAMNVTFQSNRHSWPEFTQHWGEYSYSLNWTLYGGPYSGQVKQ